MHPRNYLTLPYKYSCSKPERFNSEPSASLVRHLCPPRGNVHELGRLRGPADFRYLNQVGSQYFRVALKFPEEAQRHRLGNLQLPDHCFECVMSWLNYRGQLIEVVHATSEPSSSRTLLTGDG
ncbi:hypothetical protein T265_09571 [Opisthorchis viverrini]|uniref:Uncharacterized protein n=1 Tax=Opisthorchis viverrini TaxID=6198 RepID=A0A074Z5D0_OPIVI|nr:hypothetical protein T265_09571 [Opisthorchis viverrini]KER22283.1 hypothetical protein T265_09571 [Opisthorchis viverrini]